MGLGAFIRTLIARVTNSGPLPGQSALYGAALVSFVVGTTFYGMLCPYAMSNKMEQAKQANKVRRSLVSPTEKETIEK